jgi:hypothetical protein
MQVPRETIARKIDRAHEEDRLMKIVYRILAHDTPKDLQRLKSILSTSSVSIFLHPNASSGASAFRHLEENNVLDDEGPS